MSVKYEKLFEPIKIGPVEIPNRVAVLPIRGVVYNIPGLSCPDMDYMCFFTRRVRGGFGLIVIEGTATHPFENKYTGGMSYNLYEPKHVAGFKKLTNGIHAFGGKVFLQLSAGGFGRQYPDASGTLLPVAASPIPVNIDPSKMATNEDKTFLKHHLHWATPKEITTAEIYELIESHNNATRLAIQAGFDGVEIHCAHGYFGANFLSPNQNIRTDEFGGSFENRNRWMLESIKACMKAIKEMKAEERFVVGVRTSAEEMTPGGLTKEDVVRIHEAAIKEGSSYASLSWGAGFENHMYTHPMKELVPVKVEHAKWFNKRLDIPVIITSLNEPELAAEVADTCDHVIVGLGRQAYADPDWPNKVKEGRTRDIVKCLRCNLGCFINSRLDNGTPEWCSINPEVGYEGYDHANWPTPKKR